MYLALFSQYIFFEVVMGPQEVAKIVQIGRE